MEAEPGSATLRPTWPLGTALGLAILIVAGLFAASEALSRSDAVRRLLPLQSVGCGQPQLDRKLVLLRDAERKRGPVDCLFLGSSQTYRGVDPAVVGEAYRKAAGRELRSFNFGLGGLSETGEDLLARMLVRRFRPKLIVVGASAYGLDDDRGVAFASRLTASPWLRYHQGVRSLDGWLVEHSDAFRSWLGIRFWTDPMPPGDRAKILGMMKGMRNDGYGFSETGSFRGLDDAMTRAIGSYAVSTAHLDSLARTLGLRPEVELVVVEIPVHRSVIEHFPRKDEDYRAGLDAIERTATAAGVPFWRFPADRAIPQEGWADFQHLNVLGARAYSAWLGEKLGEEARQGRALRAAA